MNADEALEALVLSWKAAVQMFGKDSHEAKVARADVIAFGKKHGMAIEGIMRGEIDGAVPNTRRES